MKQIINIAVIGCGYWGPNLIRNFNSISDCKVKLVCDINLERLTYVKKIYPQIETTTEFDNVVNDREIDAIVIATPVRLHFELARKSLMGGKYTFIEKPMASSTAQCRELIDLAEEKNLTLMVGHTFIYSLPVQKIKEIVDSDEIGEVYYINSQRLNLGLYQKDINVAWDLATHDISIILYILEQVPRSVSCQGKANISPDIEDVTNMTINFANGGFVTILSSWLDPNKVRKITFVGSKKMLIYDDTEPLEKIKIYDKRVEIPPYYDTFAEFQYSYHYGDIYSPYLKQIEPLKVECQHFLDCIKTGAKPDSSGQEGLRVVQILEASTKSLKRYGAMVEIGD